MVKAKDIIVAIGVLVVFAIALVVVLNIYTSEIEERSAAISDLGDKDPNHIEVDVKLVSVDPNKGDVTARLEFVPKGNFSKNGGLPLERDLKLFVNSATGKQELDFRDAGAILRLLQFLPDSLQHPLYSGNGSGYC